ncbi:MAG: regulatory protein RecX [Lachnospiraceae bacterium]|nr:regulatory protein RecX [Lachnospiraceae bacterium]
MIIVEITNVTKARYKVKLEDGTEFVVYRGELQRFSMKQGEDLSQEAYQCLFHEILPKRAKLRSMNLLKSKDYTRKQLEDKLRQGGYPEEIIEEAMEYVISYGYINDENYARSYIEYHMEGRSKTRIINDLLNKGIARTTIMKMFDELKEDGIEIDELKMAQNLLRKKNYHAATATYEEKQKMYVFLYRKGFHSSVINRVLLLDIT